MSCSMKRMLVGAVVVAMSIAWTSCSDSSQGANDNEAALLSVSPRGNSTNVDPNARIRLEFQHEMQDGMEQLCVLYRGGLDGEEVPGNWEWSEEHHVLRFTPHHPLHHDAEYTLHVGGGMIDAHGHTMNFDEHGHDMGGHWIDDDMLSHHDDHGHMHDGWQHHDGHYGMAFPFRTAAAQVEQKVLLLRVSPEGGSTNVDSRGHIELEFDHPMAVGAEELCSLHLDGLDGEEVPGDWEWSHQHHVLTFTPHELLRHDAQHTLHVGGGIVGEDGHHMDFDEHGHDLGGHWVDDNMLRHHGGMMGHHSHMGEGWQHENGYYGMAFPFRTAP
jgi:hypothetical protein